VFYDPRSLELDGPEGVLHAKAIVADDESAFVTSANLTEAAFDRNIEVGVLARDRALAASLSKHFRVLIERGLLLALPVG
jgi:phosphatidylserine/phosphatidylglycerophosphate/cardiolipin synthase-like enzyme